MPFDPFLGVAHRHNVEGGVIGYRQQYPKEIHRTQKSLTQAISHFHANEYRSLATYSLIYLLMDKFTDLNYFYNLVKYILFLRFDIAK